MSCGTTHYKGCECNEEAHARANASIQSALAEARTSARQWRETSDAQDRARTLLRKTLDERDSEIAWLRDLLDRCMDAMENCGGHSGILKSLNLKMADKGPAPPQPGGEP